MDDRPDVAEESEGAVGGSDDPGESAARNLDKADGEMKVSEGGGGGGAGGIESTDDGEETSSTELMNDAFDQLDGANEALAAGEMDPEAYADAVDKFSTKMSEAMERQTEEVLAENTETPEEAAADNLERGPGAEEGGTDRISAGEQEVPQSQEMFDEAFEKLDAANDALAEGEMDLESYNKALDEFNDQLADAVERQTQELTADAASPPAAVDEGSEQSVEGMDRHASPGAGEPPEAAEQTAADNLEGAPRRSDATADREAPGEQDVPRSEELIDDAFSKLDAANEALADGEISPSEFAEAIDEFSEQYAEGIERQTDEILGDTAETVEGAAAENLEATAESQTSVSDREMAGNEDTRATDVDEFMADTFEDFEQANEAFGAGEMDPETYAEAVEKFNERLNEGIERRTEQILQDSAETPEQSTGERPTDVPNGASQEREGDSAASDRAPPGDAQATDSDGKLAGTFETVEAARTAFDAGDIDAETLETAIQDHTEQHAAVQIEQAEATPSSTETAEKTATQGLSGGRDRVAEDRIAGDTTTPDDRPAGDTEASVSDTAETEGTDRRTAGADAEREAVKNARETIDKPSIERTAAENLDSAPTPSETSDAPRAGDDSPPGSDSESSAAVAEADRARLEERGTGAPGTDASQMDWDHRGWEAVENAEEYDNAVPEDDVEQAVVDFLDDQGITPPEGTSLQLDDYVDTNITVATGSDYPSTTATIRVDADGNMLPSGDAIEANRPEGGYEDGSLAPAERLYSFEVKPVPDGEALVVSSELSVESAVIKNQNDAWSENTSDGYAAGLRESFEASGISLGDATTAESQTDGHDQPISTDAVSAAGQAEGVEPESNEAAEPAGSDAPDPTSDAGAPDDEQGAQSTDGPASTSSEETDRQPTEVHEGPPDAYAVEQGDTLSAIAEETYGDASKWPVIYEANSEQIADPDLIQPGQELTIPDQETAEQFDRSEYDEPDSTGLGEGEF